MSTSDLIKKSHSKRGKPGTLKAKIDGPITKAKVRALKNRPGATTLDKKQANFYLNMHSESVSTQPHPEVVKAHKKLLDADDKAAEYNHRANKARATRARNHLSKMINKHHPGLDMKGKIAIHTALQNMQEDVAATSTASIPNPAQTAMGRRPKLTYMYDRRRKKDKPPVLLKRFRKYMTDNG